MTRISFSHESTSAEVHIEHIYKRRTILPTFARPSKGKSGQPFGTSIIFPAKIPWKKKKMKIVAPLDTGAVSDAQNELEQSRRIHADLGVLSESTL